MLLSDALDLHKSFVHKLALEDILGDGFLLQSNFIYRRVRELSLEIGCAYIEAYPQYLLLPFYELPVIVETGKIPYVPHARLMTEIESGRPGVFTADEMPMPESYHLHESAHVIAEHFFKRVDLQSREERILKAILCESFANTVDALACMPAGDDIHRFFIKQNCYMHPQKKVILAMKEITEGLGFRFTFMLTYFTYVRANFLAKPLSQKDARELARRCASGVKLSPRLLKAIRAIIEIGEKLDPQFRITTTGNYLRLEGFEGDVYDLLDFSFQKILEDNRELGQAIEALAVAIAPAT